jgi:YD repeat-containing protein
MRNDVTTLEFRPDGSLARRLHHNPDGSEWKSTYEYDERGRMTAMRSENGAGVVDLVHYEYDDAWRPARVIARSDSGGDRVVESYDYSPAGCRTKTHFIDVAAHGPKHNYFLGVEGTDTHYSTPGATTFTTVYNEFDRPTDLFFYDGAGRQLSRVEFRYDPDGNLVEEAQTIAAEMLPPEMLASMNPAQSETMRRLFGMAGEPMRTMHSLQQLRAQRTRSARLLGKSFRSCVAALRGLCACNEQGRRIETRSRMGPLGGNVRTMAYKDHGDLIGETSERDERQCGIDDEGRLSDASTRESVSRSEARFRYDYDARRNWVMKTVEGTSSVERRAITYFD